MTLSPLPSKFPSTFSGQVLREAIYATSTFKVGERGRAGEGQRESGRAGELERGRGGEVERERGSEGEGK